LDEDDEAASSVMDVDAASANNDLECDLEELASTENGGKEDEGDTSDSVDSVDDTGSDDDKDDDDDDTQLQSEDILVSADNNDRGSDVDISEHIVSSSVPDNDAGISEDTSSAATRIGQASVSAVSEAIASVDMNKHELSTESPSEKVTNTADEFPDTSIDLHHISGSTYVTLSC